MCLAVEILLNFHKIFLRANLATFENRKIAPHCRIAYGVYGPLVSISVRARVILQLGITLLLVFRKLPSTF